MGNRIKNSHEKEYSVSLIIPIYRGRKHIKHLLEMLDKLKGSNYRLEVILVNDYPQEPIEFQQFKCLFHISIQYIENEINMGIHRSRVNGLRHAKGEYIVFLDQDDSIMSDYFERQTECLTDEDDAVICNGLYRMGEKIFSESNKFHEYSLAEYLINGYPLVSLGQLLIRKNSIPSEWLEKYMSCNGWDDHFLWAAMMLHGTKVAVNDAVLYVHEEDGNNLSFNWKQMIMSGREFKDIFLQLGVLNEYQKLQFKELVDNKIYKYEIYEKLSENMNKMTKENLVSYLKMKGFYKIVIYGMGVYGKTLFQTLENTDIHVLCGIDKRKDIKDIPLPIMSLYEEKLSDFIEKADVIVVSAVFAFREIKDNIGKQYKIKIVSLLDILEKNDL